MRLQSCLIAILAVAFCASCDPIPLPGAPHIPDPTPPRHGKTCAGIAALQCGSGDTCVIPAGTCRMPDAGGICRTRPQVCYHLVKPVCGCDGKTYNNSCEAQRAGASVLHDGACKAE